MGVAAGEKLIAAAIELASGNQRSGSFESHLPEKLLGGAVVQDLVHAAATHRITGSAAISVASDVVKLVEAQSGAARLPGPAEAQYVLAKLDAAAQDAQLTDLHKELQSNYGLALNIGNTIAPLVDELGWKVGALALNIGTQLASMTDPTTGGEAASIVKLETAARSAGVSVDAALALAGMNAIGHSQVLNLEITDRLLSGLPKKSWLVSSLTTRSPPPTRSGSSRPRSACWRRPTGRTSRWASTATRRRRLHWRSSISRQRSQAAFRPVRNR
jgi:hypothetical protein